jgi:Na+-translocating ferredoxin:NAD+ oxidoreductase RnfD subunit
LRRLQEHRPYQSVGIGYGRWTFNPVLVGNVVLLVCLFAEPEQAVSRRLSHLTTVSTNLAEIRCCVCMR